MEDQYSSRMLMIALGSYWGRSGSKWRRVLMAALALDPLTQEERIGPGSSLAMSTGILAILTAFSTAAESSSGETEDGGGCWGLVALWNAFDTAKSCLFMA